MAVAVCLSEQSLLGIWEKAVECFWHLYIFCGVMHFAQHFKSFSVFVDGDIQISLCIVVTLLVSLLTV